MFFLFLRTPEVGGVVECGGLENHYAEGTGSIPHSPLN